MAASMITQIWILTWLEITDMVSADSILSLQNQTTQFLEMNEKPQKVRFSSNQNLWALSTISTMNLTNLRWQKLALSEHVITKRHMKRSTLHYCFKPKAMTFQSDRESFDNERTVALNVQLKRKSFTACR